MTTAREKLCRKQTEKIKVLDSDFAGITAGSRMLVATPRIVDDFIRSIPPGRHSTVPAMRNILARRYKCDAACPVSTAIFTRISAEAAVEAMEDGADASEVTPFWRVLRGTDKIAGRLKVEPLWIDNQRAAEGLPV